MRDTPQPTTMDLMQEALCRCGRLTGIRTSSSDPMLIPCSQNAAEFHDPCPHPGTPWSCADDNGEEKHPTINLNRCLGSDRGTLVCKSRGDFIYACRNCELQGTNLVCLCRTSSTDYGITNIHLEECVVNNGGQLNCSTIETGH
ncbi:hypothetical protein BJ138DRAFT_84992 [Hygrophoropsis aurantiaca]|uniref:Uncharacterized protein n=1 Tax=Hygrophoropsis aurantiaca TaxID=72124 RepID=A0ACB7ZRP8_9AGAM|nr:hypothetical protein BJ138DRAFT_84992 [Hygrophoropsis aurantiaca]